MPNTPESQRPEPRKFLTEETANLMNPNFGREGLPYITPFEPDVKQVTPEKPQKGHEYAMTMRLDQEPEDLSEKFGLVFEEGQDDLDYYKLAAIKVSQGQAWLWKYLRCPNPYPERVPKGGIDVMIYDEQESEITKAEVLSLLELNEQNILWKLGDTWPENN